MPSRSQTSADLINAEEHPTSDGWIRTASKSVMHSLRANRRLTPRQSNTSRQCGSGRDNRKVDGALIPCSIVGIGDVSEMIRQPRHESTGCRGQNPYGVESDATTDNGISLEPGNLRVASRIIRGMIEATEDRQAWGQSPRSSQRTGKPSTRRRGTGVEWTGRGAI